MLDVGPERLEAGGCIKVIFISIAAIFRDVSVDLKC